MPNPQATTEEDEWEKVPSAKAAKASSNDGDWEPVPAAADTAAPSGEGPSDEDIEKSYGKDVTPKLRAALKSGVAPMQKPTNFEEENKRPFIENFGMREGTKLEPQEYLGLPSKHLLGQAAEGAKGLISSGAQAAYDATLGEENPETGELEHGLGGLIGMNTKGEIHPLDRAGALARKYVTDPAVAEWDKGNEAGGLPGIGHKIAAMLPLVGPYAAQLGEQAGTGDVGGAGANAVGTALAGELAPKVAEKSGELVKAGAKKLGEPLTIGMPGEDMITKGVRPRARATGWTDAMQSPGVQRAIKTYDAATPIENMEDLKDAVPVMKEKMWDEKVQPALDRQGPRPVDMKPAAEKIRAAITPEMREFDPSGVEQMEDIAAKLEKSRTVDEANALQKYLNTKVQAYFDKYPTARRSAMASNPEMAGWENARQGVREQLASTLEEAGETQTAEARRDYGHLTTLEKELERKVNVNDRKSPINLARTLGLIGAIPTHGLSMVAGEVISHLNNPDNLIRRGIGKLNPPAEAPFTAPQPFKAPGPLYGEDVAGPVNLHSQEPAGPELPAHMKAPFEHNEIARPNPNQSQLWQTQVGGLPQTGFAPNEPLAAIGDTSASPTTVQRPLGPHEGPPPEPGLGAIHGQQMPLQLPEGPEEAPLFNLGHINEPKYVPELQKLPGTSSSSVGMEQEPILGGPGRVGALGKIGDIKVSEGEDLGPGMGTEHILTKDGKRIGSVTVEPKPGGELHVHWLGGDIGRAGIKSLVEDLKTHYPETEKLTYDRRRLAKGASAATTEPREIELGDIKTPNDWEAISGEIGDALREEAEKKKNN